MFSRICLVLSLVSLAAGIASAQITVYEHRGVAFNDQVGAAVSQAGDVDGDGWPDVAISAPASEAGGVNAGQVDILSGRDGSVILSVFGPPLYSGFGRAIDALGDIDGDGLGDLIIGAPAASNSSGLVRIVSGTGQTLIALSVGGPNSSCGKSVAGLGDIDGDGVGDFAFGTPGFSGVATKSGRFDVYSGAGLQLLYWVEGTQAFESLGYSMDSAGDVNGDGHNELVVGTPFADHPFSFQKDVGRMSVYSLNSSSATLLFSRLGSASDEWFGWSVAGLGDVDGDGLSDVAIGVPEAKLNGAHAGRALVIAGAAPHGVIWSQDGQAFQNLGWSVAGFGDMDGDGRGELGVGAPGFSFLAANAIGRVQAISPHSGQVLYTWNGSVTGERLGNAVSGAGDLNLDGFADALLGAEKFNAPGIDEAGRALVVLAQAPYPTGYCTAKVNSAGCTPQISYSGAPCVSISGAFLVSASQVLNSVPGMLIWSKTSASLPFGGGFLCVGSPVQRTGGQSSGSTLGTACGGSFHFNMSHDFLALNGLTAGTTLYTQYWSRDQGFATPNNMSLTAALALTLVP